jgi:curved DNA-binding protein CbpA
MRDYYAILEVPPTASQEVIREQYLLLIQAWHPDKFRTPKQKAKAEERCKEINSAYDILKDIQKRARYDRELRGQSSRVREEARHRPAYEQRQRKQAEGAQRRQAEEPWQQSEPTQEERARAEAEGRARAAEEWIRVFFEQARRRQSGEAAAGPRQGSQQPIRVLIVDDAADTRTRIRELLSGEADLKVVGEASNGVEAIRQFEALRPDVTTICINMPAMDGIAATEAICRKHPLAKVIVISVQSDTNYIRRSAMAGARDYLMKPPSAGDLLLAIRLAARRQGEEEGGQRGG